MEVHGLTTPAHDTAGTPIIVKRESIFISEESVSVCVCVCYSTSSPAQTVGPTTLCLRNRAHTLIT